MSPQQFLLLNLKDAETRLKRLTVPDRPDSPDLWRELEHSAATRVVASLNRVMRNAAPESRARMAWQAATQAVAATDPIHRMRAIGGLTVTAALTHIALIATTSPVGGWWLILPGIVLTFGVAALGLSWLGPSSKGRE